MILTLILVKGNYSVKDSSTLSNLRKRFYSTVARHFLGLALAVRGVLAAFGAMSLDGRTLPSSLIFEGVPGSGKSTVLQMAFPVKDSQLMDYV